MAAGYEDIPVDESLASDDTVSFLDDASRISLASTFAHYKLENSRHYHTYRDGSYWAPHDKEAVEMDTVAHHMFLLTFNDKLFLAPLEDPKKVLDVGTGNGIWPQNFSDKFPDADIIGTDLARVQEDVRSQNLHFEIDDCCSDWVYPLDHFDYIHVRQLFGSVGDWDVFYKECYDHLAPGGWLEHAEASPILTSDDGSIPANSPFDQGARLTIECGELNGKPMKIQPYIRDWIAKAGFVDVVEEKFKWPVGDWPADQRLKDIGKWNARQWNSGIEGWSMRLLTQCHGWTVPQVKKWNEEIRATIKARKCHAYQPLSVVYARKPLS